MKYYRVKFGYGRDDFYSVDETEVRKAIRAQVTGEIAIFAEGTIAGNSIIAIMPDYQRMMGWNRDHELNGEDHREIGDKRKEDCVALLEAVRREVAGLPPQESKELSDGVKRIAGEMQV